MTAMKEYYICISEKRLVTNRYSIRAKSLEAVRNMTTLEIIANAAFVEWVGDSELDNDFTVDEIEEAA